MMRLAGKDDKILADIRHCRALSFMKYGLNMFLGLLVTTALADSGDDSFHGLVRQVNRRRQADKPLRNPYGLGQRIAFRRSKMLVGVQPVTIPVAMLDASSGEGLRHTCCFCLRIGAKQRIATSY